MMLVLFLIAAVMAQTTTVAPATPTFDGTTLFGLQDTVALCSHLYTQCAADTAGCAFIDYNVFGALNADPDAPVVMDISLGSTAVATAISQTAFIVGESAGVGNYPYYFGLLECQCFFTDGCDWGLANSVASAAAMCLADDNCIAAWDNIESTSSDKGSKWDDLKTLYGTRINMPSVGQEDKEICIIGAAGFKEQNAKASALLNVLTANMANGDEVLETCAKGVAGIMLGGILGTGFGVLLLTLMGSFAYCKWCQNKD